MVTRLPGHIRADYTFYFTSDSTGTNIALKLGGCKISLTEFKDEVPDVAKRLADDMRPMTTDEVAEYLATSTEEDGD